MPLFSVIIPTYNRVELQRQALASVLAQTFTDYEVIVVDDGSTDRTWEELQALGQRIHALRQDNAGPGVARNLGAKYATGDYLAFLDSDDVWFPWALNVVRDVIQDAGGPAIVSTKFMEFTSPPELVSVRNAPVITDVFSDYFASHESGYFVGAGTAVLRRERFLGSGGFTARRINAEDHDLILRLGTVPGFVQIRSPVMLGWRRHLGGATRNVRDTFEGCLHLAAQERNGTYPGGKLRMDHRREILTRHLRSASVECLRRGYRTEAWRLYRASFTWHVRLGRWKYLVGFPIQAVSRWPGRPMSG